jgi:signal recognition particle subunit SRP54
VDISNDDFKKVECIIQSMTPQERANPDMVLTNTKRKARIAKGSGKKIEDINAFTKQFDQMRKMMHQFSTGNMPGMPGMPQRGGFRR